jgi:uncharacterized protein DUF3499
MARSSSGSGGGCARPACGATAAAILTYDYATRTAWLDPLGEPILGAWSVCAAHADGLKVPVGWGLHDRRRPLTTIQGSLAS